MLHERDMARFEAEWRHKLTGQEYMFQVGLKNQEFEQRTNETNQRIAFERERWQTQFRNEWAQRERIAQINIAMTNAVMQQGTMTAAQQAALGLFQQPMK